MKWKRTAGVVLLFTGLVWLSIEILGPIGIRGLAGPVIRNNLKFQTDATSLFYTEIDQEIFRPARD